MSKVGSQIKSKKKNLQTLRATSPIPSPFNIWPAFFQYKFLKRKSEPHVKIEGKDTDDWLCVDFGK